VKRECYTLGSFCGQTKKPSSVRGSGLSKLERIVAPSCRDLQKRVRHPGRLVPFPPKRYRRQIWRIRLDKQTIARHQPHQIVVFPLVERDDPRERDVPTRVERELGERVRTGVAVQDADHVSATRVEDDRSSVVFGIPRVDDDRLPHFFRKRKLSRERGSLCISRRIVVVVVEPAFADSHSGVGEQSAQLRDVAGGVKRRRVVRMNSGGREDEPGIVPGALGSDSRRSE